MAILTYIDSNTLIYYAKGPGLDLLSNLNSQLIITDAVRIEATRGSSPDAGIISDWINTNVADGKVVVPITPEGAALAADLTLKDMGEQSIITDAQTAVQPRDTVQIYSGDDIPAKYFAGQSIVSPDDVRGIGQSLNDIQDAVGFQNPDYANYRDGLVKAGANPEGFQSNGDLGLTNGSATGSSSTDIQASESDAQSFSSVVENTAGAPDGAAIAAEVEGATAVLDAVGLAALSIYVTTEAVQAVQQAETGDYSGAATTVADTAAGVGGMIAGAEAGGEIGAEMGAFFGPEGAAAGAIIGGVAGAVAGAATAQSVANTLGQAIGNALTDLTNFFGGAPSGNGGNDGGGSGNNGNQPYGPFGPNGPNGPNGPDGPNAPYGPNGPNPIGPSGPRKSGGKNGEARKDPLVIDLAGTGVNLVGRTWLSPYFDFTGDGFAQNTAWIGSGTGFLAVLGSDGTIDNGSDLITSFAQLAAMDTNGDGVVNSSDADFNNIVIWQDTNGDGIAQPNEIETLSQAGIVSISLTTTPASQSINGSEVVATAVATMADGTTREVASVDFDTSSFYTKYAGSYTLNSTIESLPNLQGYGTLPDLWISMSKDSTLESLVQQLTQTDPGNTATFDSALQSVLYEWAGVENVAPSSGNVFDGQKLGFLSAYLGDLSGFGLQNSRTPWFSGQSNLLQASWNDAFSAIKADLLVQLPNSVFANDFRLDPGTGLLTPQSTLSDSIIDLSIQAPTDPAGQIAFWTNALLVIGTSIADMSQYVTIDTVQIESILRTVAPSTFSTDVLNAVATGSLTYVQGSQLNNALVGTSGGDFAILTQPNSSFTGFGGNDEILVNDGLGNVEINEVDNSISPDNVLLLGAGISPSDVTVTADKAGDAVLTLADGNTIKLDYEIFGPNSGSEQAAGHTSITFGPDTNYGVQEVEFADGTVWTQQQTIGMELASATAGNDTLVGGSAPETFDGKGGSDYEQGGGNGDTFIFNQGYGKLEINETASSLTADNILKLGPGIDPSQVTVSGDTNGDVVLTIGSSGDQITIDKMLDQSFDGPQYGAQAIEFADGTVWTPQIVLAKQAINTNYTEKFTGTSGPDVFAAVSGNIYEQGEGGDDTFNFDAGDGQLEINEYDTSASPSNMLQLGAGIAPSNITVTGTSTGEIVLTVGSNGDQITFDNMLYGSAYGVQKVEFADGSSWTRQDLINAALTGTTGSDKLYGTAGADVFDGKGGNDYEQGGGGGDTFVFNSGYGQLEINEVDYSANPSNVLQLGAGITPSEISAGTDSSGDVVLTIGSNGDQVKLDGMLNSPQLGAQEIDFADGTIWNRAQVLADSTVGTTGNDKLYGTSGPDVFDGKGGDDYEQGKGGGDTFIFNSGYGQLEINEYDTPASPDNILQLGNGITPSDVVVTADSNGNLYLTDGISGDQIKIDSMLNSGRYGVQAVEFADGTTWTRQDVIDAELTGTTGNDKIYGTTGPDVIDGKGGDDYEQGDGGNDTFTFNPGYGQLEINEADNNPNANNVLQLGAGIDPSQVGVSEDSSGDIILTDGVAGDKILLDNMLNGNIYNGGSGTQYGVEHINFADGTVWTAMQVFNMATTGTTGNDKLYGTSGPDVFDGRGGNDVETGNGGGDTFIFNAGYGHLEISELDLGSNPRNTLELGTGIDTTNTTVTSTGSNIILTDGVTGDQVTIDNMLSTASWGVQSVSFADGTVWTRQDVIDKELTGTTGNDNIYGTPGADTIDGKGGNDYEQGGGGGDTFIFNADYGHVEISELDLGSNPGNTLDLGTGIAPANVTVTSTGSNIILTDGVTGDQVTIDNMLSTASWGVQSVSFADGTVWARQDVIDKELTGTTGNDNIYGTPGADTIDGKGGNDYEQGGGGGDTFIFNPGYGHLEINELDLGSNPNNTLKFGAGISASNVHVTSTGSNIILTDGITGDQVTIDNMLSQSYWGLENVSFADGTDWTRQEIINYETTGTTGNDTLYGSYGADTFDGKGGNDYEQGAGGNDTFIFNSGYGHLEISEFDLSSNPDNTLKFGPGISASSVVVSASGNNVLLTDGVTGDQVTIDNMRSSSTWGIQSVAFSDGSSWSRQEIVALVNASQDVGTTGNDTLYGSSGPDVMDGKGGNDYEQGNGGGDTFIFNSGYGHLEISETDFGSNPHNSLLLGPGITAANVHVTSDGNSITLTDGVSGDQITLVNMLSHTLWGVQTVSFADGTSWSRQDVINKETTGTTGNDALYGSPGADTFDGKGGNDYEQGGGGNDTFTFNSGYGHLEISETDFGSNPHNILLLGPGITAANVHVTSDGNSITLTDGVSGDQITVDNMLTHPAWGVQTVSFADGTSWSRQDVINKETTGTTGNDVLYGSPGADTFDGKGGNDYEQGDGGNDTFIFNSGYGHLEINELDLGSNPNNTLKFGSGINASNVSVTSTGSNIILTDGVSGDQVAIDNMLSQTYWGIQSVSFADGTNWSRQNVINKETTGTTGNDSLYGTSGAETFDGKGGNDYEQGNGGADIYDFNEGYGQLTIANSVVGGSGAHGDLEFGSGITDEDLWFTNSGNNLIIQEIGNPDKITISGWFGTNTSSKLAEIELSSGLMLDSQLGNLVSAMATYSANNPGFNPATATEMPADTTLQSAITSAWHS